MTATTLDPLAYYAANACALFPIPAGSKNPTGIVESFKHDHSADPSAWEAWRIANPGCNFGLVAFASRLIIVDIDTTLKEEITDPDARAKAVAVARDEAWALWCSLCADWGIPPAQPHVNSARGGWHVYFAVPADVDASQLRQPDAIKGRINLRCVGYTVAAGSYYDGTAKQEQSGHYTLLSDAPPHPAPQALLEHCTRRARATTVPPPGSRDKGDVAGLLTWLSERDVFAAYEDWVSVGMSLALEYGDDGFSIWELTFDDAPATLDLARSKWESFSREPDAHSVTLNSFLQRAHSLGWRGQVRKSAAGMFSDVAAIAAAAGANLHSALPLPPANSLPMMAGQEELARLAAPILDDFLSATADAPANPAAMDLPALPDAMSGHGLFSLMSASLTRVFSLAETPKLKPGRLIDPLAVLCVMHADVFESTCRRLRTMGHTLPDRKIKLAAENLSEKIERVTVTLDKWEYDARSGEIQNDNPDNVSVLLGVLGLEVRWNAWLERMEIQGGTDIDLRWSQWTYIDDAIVAKLMTRAKRTKTRFRPGKEFMWETLLSLTHANSIDPVLDTLSSLAAAWDRTPRLITWLARYCGTPCDPYHQAVGRSIIGGIVTRARHPGVKFDLMPIFYGLQGTGKSTLAAILALRLDWFSDNILLGDASKELVLSLAGKLVVEIGEMGMRSNTNASTVKAMISRQVDAGRTAYARAVTERPRRNVFIGTTNDETPLSDPTGNRRFLPIHITQEIDLAGLAADIGQIMGEAAALEAAGVSFDLPREIWGIAAAHQEAARASSDIEILLSDYFAVTDAGAAGSFVTVPDLVKLCDATGRKNVGAVAAFIMKRLGFRHDAPRIEGKRTNVWVRAPDDLAPRLIPTLPRYMLDLSNAGSPRVVLRGAVTLPPVADGAANPMPPVPDPRS